MIEIVAMTDIVKSVDIMFCPYDTGNLCNNGIGNIESFGINSAGYHINEHDEAPYGVILNEALTIKDRANRHYGWHDNAVDKGVNALALAIGGTVL